MKFQICGLYRTGTNYLRNLLLLNFKFNVYQHMYWNKHYVPTLQKIKSLGDDAVILISIKNPYAYILSRKKSPNQGIPHLPLIEQVEYYVNEYNYFYRALDDVFKRNNVDHMWCPYEGVLDNLELSIKMIAKKMKTRGPDVIQDYHPTTIAHGPDDKMLYGDTSRYFDKSFYLEHKYFNKLNDEEKNLITEEIDWGFFNKFYQPISQKT